MSSWLKLQLGGWAYHGERLKRDHNCDSFAKEVQQLSESLRETITIDKKAVKLFKVATGFHKGENLSTLKSILYKSRLSLDIQTTCDGLDDSLHQDKVVSQSFGKWEFENSIERPKEVDVLPKEAIVIKKDVTKYIKECIDRAQDTTRNLKAGGETTNRFLIELINSEEVLSHKEPHLRLPEAMRIDRFSDSAYLEEDLIETVIMTGGDAGLISRKTMPANLRLISPFQFLEAELVAQKSERVLSFPRITIDLGSINIDYFKCLEKFTLEEQLDKGVEYRINSPFIPDEPVFKECLNSFDLCCINLPKELTVEFDGPDALFIKFKNFDEGQVIEEEIEGVSLELFNHEYFSLTKLRIIQDHLIWVTEAEIEKTETKIAATKPAMTEILVTKALADLNVESESDTTLSTYQSNRVSNSEAKDLDTLGATKMETSYIEFSSVKRTLDEEIEELMTKKRKSDITPSTGKVHAGSVQFLNIVEDMKSFTSEAKPTLKPSLHCNRTIVYNDCTLHDSIISSLKKVDGLSLLKYAMDSSGPDIILSSFLGILLFDSTTVNQISLEGNLKVHERIQFSKRLYHKLYAIILIDSIGKEEETYQLQICLAALDVHVIILSSERLDAVSKICEISMEEGVFLSESDEERLEEPEALFLLECSLNPFACLQVLEEMSVFDFVSMDKQERDKLKYITLYSSDHTHDLFSALWSLG